MGWIRMFHMPGVRKMSQLALTGVVWFQSMIVRARDVQTVTTMRTHSAILCQRSWTTRSRKRPIDSLAMALPVIAKLLATYVQKMALEASSGLRLAK